jgi:hypothetical protein
MSWDISGQYQETCNCDFVCPCPLTGLRQTTHGTCTFAMAFRIERGSFDGMDLGGTKFVVVGRTPGNMAEGNWEVGVIVDEAASPEQKRALGAIASGQAGGPIASLAPLLGTFHGVEERRIHFEGSDDRWSVRVPDLIDQAVEGARGLGGEILHLDNTGHPAANRLALAHATRTHIHAFGIAYDEASGRNNGHFAPFHWSGGS